MNMLNQGQTPREIRTEIDRKYASNVDNATPTPYPPA